MKRNSTKFAILGMLSLGPMSGYDIKKTISQSIAHFWSESYGQIYPMLHDLRAAGLVRPASSRGMARGRQVYALTPKGNASLIAWLAEEPRDEPARSELLLKLFFGRHMGPGIAASHIAQYRAQHRELLHTYRQIERLLRKEHTGHPDLPYWLATLRFGQLRSQAVVRWCNEVGQLVPGTPSRGAAPHRSH